MHPSWCQGGYGRLQAHQYPTGGVEIGGAVVAEMFFSSGKFHFLENLQALKIALGSRFCFSDVPLRKPSGKVNRSTEIAGGLTWNRACSRTIDLMILVGPALYSKLSSVGTAGQDMFGSLVSVIFPKFPGIKRHEAKSRMWSLCTYSGDSWMYLYQRTSMGNPYISPI